MEGEALLFFGVAVLKVDDKCIERREFTVVLHETQYKH